MMTTANLLCRAGLALGLALAASTIASAKGLNGHLHGSEWGFVGDPPGAERFVQFTGGKRLVGSGGCNRFSGSFDHDDHKLAIGPVISTRRACAPDVMQREQDFFQLFQQVRTADATHLELVLKDESGKVLATLRRRDPD